MCELKHISARAKLFQGIIARKDIGRFSKSDKISIIFELMFIYLVKLNVFFCLKINFEHKRDKELKFGPKFFRFCQQNYFFSVSSLNKIQPLFLNKLTEGSNHFDSVFNSFRERFLTAHFLMSKNAFWTGCNFWPKVTVN